MRNIALMIGGSLVALMALNPTAAASGDTVADRVFGQAGSFTTNSCNSGTISASSLCRAGQIAIDSGGHLYVVDGQNNRVLEYDTPLTSQVANRVFGQGGSFTSNTPNNGGVVTAASLWEPAGVAVDSMGHLYLADRINNRVLEYDSPLTSQVANRVFGQPDFISNAPNNGGVSASSLCAPLGITVDGAGHLYVAESLSLGICSNNRVLEYDTPLTSQVANRVFGQGGSFSTFTCNNGGRSASSLCNPNEVAVDNAGRLYISDSDNNRELEYDSPLTSQVADRVFGQGGSFTSGTCNNGGRSASSLCHTAGVTVDSGGHLFIAEYLNNRVLEYDTPLTSQVANRVFGQGGSFTSDTCNNGGPSAGSLCQPVSVLVDGSGNLYVGEEGNNRVLEYDSPLPSAPSVGGIAEAPDVNGSSPRELGAPAGGSGWSGGNDAALAIGLAAAAVVLSAGAWYARRRFSRS